MDGLVITEVAIRVEVTVVVQAGGERGVGDVNLFVIKVASLVIAARIAPVISISSASDDVEWMSNWKETWIEVHKFEDYLSVTGKHNYHC